MIPEESGARSQSPPGVEIHPVLLSTFGEQFAACLALDGFSREHRPDSPPTRDAAGHIIVWTYARSTKTFRASLQLAAAGYGEQALMTNRSLFEDMAMAYWVKRHPEEASGKFTRHGEWARARWHEGLQRAGVPSSSTKPPQLTPSERKELNEEFKKGTGTWAGLSLPGVITDVRDEWPAPLERDLFERLVKIVNTLNNTVLHHNAISLSLAGKITDTGAKHDVGPSETLIESALFGAFFPYANTVSLVLTNQDREAFQTLYAKHLQAFVARKHLPNRDE